MDIQNFDLLSLLYHTGVYLFIINTVQTSIREYKAQIHARKQNVQHFRLYSWINTKIVYNPFLKVIYIGCFNCSSWEAVPYFDSGREKRVQINV